MNTLEETKNLIEELKKKLNQWNYEYYVLDTITVDDSVYDKTLKELFELEEKYPQFSTDDSPTKKVGIAIKEENFVKANHNIRPMLSLRNAFNESDLLHFNKQINELNLGEFSFFVEPKIDGLSMSLSYENGNLIRAVTRGDGRVGEIVTNNIFQIKSIPKKIKYKGKIEVRGEVYLPLESFNNLNDERLLENKKLISEGKKPLSLFANPRNAASGTIRQLNPQIVKKRNLDAFFFDLLFENEKENFIKTQKETLETLETWGFKINSFSKEKEDLKESIKWIYFLENQRKTLDYEIDGVVIKINQKFYYSDIGNTTKFPKWAIAYKFPAEVKETKLLDIFPTVGRTGRITYNAKLEPINLLGTTVQRATLHNANYVKELNINIGDYVFVKKAGDIIPKVISLSTEHKKNNPNVWKEETICPGCKSKLVTFDDEVDQYCLNINCPAKILESLIHFASREAMNIEGLSEQQIKKFYYLGWIKNVLDIYYLKDHKEEILSLEGYKEKSVNNLLESIENSKNQDLANFLFALGIRYIGKKSASDLAKNYLTIDKIINLTFEELENFNTFGTRKSESIINFFSNRENINLINSFKDIGVNLKYTNLIIDKENKYYKKKVLITGTIPGGTREDAKNKLLALGAEIKTTISNNLDYLLVGEKPSSSKIKKIDENKIIYVESINDIK